MVIEIILYLVVLATSLPAGLFLAWLCDDELIKDRKYLVLLLLFSVLCALVVFIFYFKPSIVLSLIYLSIILYILIRKGKKLESKLKGKKSKK